MNTSTTETTAAPAARKKRKSRACIVELNGKPCARRTYSREIFGARMVPRKGTLVPAPLPEIFPGPRTADKAVGRAVKLRAKLTGAVCDIAHRFPELTQAGDFRVKRIEP